MAIQRDNKPPVNRVNTEYLEDFSGGLNTTISGSLLNKNEAQIAIDVSFEQKGTLRPRKGRLKRYGTLFSNSPCTGIGSYYKKDGTSRLLVSSGDSLYSDSPHMSEKWDAKADWEKAGTTLKGHGTTTKIEGSVAMTTQSFGVTGSCESTSLWTPVDATLDLDTTYKFPDKCLKTTIATGKTTGYAKADATINSGTYYVISAYLKNGNAATGVRIVVLKADGSVYKNSDYVTATTWTKAQLKLDNLDGVNSDMIGIQVTGAAGQYAFVDGMYYIAITQTQFNDSSYVAPDYDYFETFKRSVVYDADADFNKGTKTNLVITGGQVQLDVEFPTTTMTQTSQADFNLGTLTNVSTTDISGSVVLARQ